MKMNKTLTVTLAGLVSAAAILLTGDLTAQQPAPRPAGPFTAAQVAAGKAAYEKNCSSCHLPTLAGSGDASALAGTPFMSNWGARNAGQLHSFIQTSMPPTAANSLGADTYLAITAYILDRNGASSGTTALAANNNTTIGVIANGQPAGAPAAAKGGKAPATDGKGRGVVAAAPPKGITHPGEVKNYVPVTDAMLKNPPASDWLVGSPGTELEFAL